MADDIFDRFMEPRKMPQSVLEAVAVKLNIDATDVIIMASYRKKIRSELKAELQRQRFI